MIENEMDKLFRMQKVLQHEDLSLQQLAKEFQIEYHTVCAWQRIGLLTVPRSSKSSGRGEKAGVWRRGSESPEGGRLMASNLGEAYNERAGVPLYDSAEDCAGNK